MPQLTAPTHDVVIVGGGHNALVAAAYLARAGRKVIVLERTALLSGYEFPGLHVVGGGTQNTLLQQFTADAIGRPVWAGPTEATAIGNVLGQLLASRRIDSLQEGRDLVRASFPHTTYEPENSAAWDDAYERYLAIRTTT